MLTLFSKICDKLGISLSFLNRDHSPSNKVSIKYSSVGSFQQASGDIHNVLIHNQQTQTRPRIDTSEYAGTGGPDGTFVTLKVKNDGTETAVDIRGELTADDFQGSAQFDVAHNLSPGQESHSINYPYNNTDFFTRLLVNPRIIFRYQSADGRSFVTGRTIIQESRNDGRYNIHTKRGAYFEERQSE